MIARTLPATLAPRFADAPRATARTELASFELVVAEGFLLRLRGLARLDQAEVVPLLFPRLRSLHTFWMRVPIDIVWLDLEAGRDGEVLGLEEALAPRRIVRAPRGTDRGRIAVLELAAGDAEALGLAAGTRLLIADGA